MSVVSLMVDRGLQLEIIPSVGVDDEEWQK